MCIKKVLFAGFFVLLNAVVLTPVLAFETTEAAIKEKCSGYSAEGRFESGFSCKNGVDIFYLQGIQVSKKDFDASKADYDLRGDLCTETVSSTGADWPKDFFASCKKDEYGKYFYKGKKVTFKVFTQTLFGTALNQAIADGIDASIEQLTKEKKVLKSFKTFVAAVESKEYPGLVAYSLPTVGSECSSGERILINETGYEIAECVNGEAVRINYYWHGKRMTYQNYLKAAYKSHKKGNAQALKEMKKR